ncbi:hypothetical protein SGPA1_10505 [Streptomyces misionensis JCM 4497]
MPTAWGVATFTPLREGRPSLGPVRARLSRDLGRSVPMLQGCADVAVRSLLVGRAPGRGVAADSCRGAATDPSEWSTRLCHNGVRRLRATAQWSPRAGADRAKPPRRPRRSMAGMRPFATAPSRARFRAGRPPFAPRPRRRRPRTRPVHPVPAALSPVDDARGGTYPLFADRIKITSFIK